MSKAYTAALIIIGDEILSGRTEDANLAYIAHWLNEEGIRLAEVRVVSDDRDNIAEAVNILKDRNDYLFTTGGIGPTHDDITVDSVAFALGVEVIYHPKALTLLAGYYGKENLTENRKRMARVPAGADLINNPMSGAPGIRIGNVFMMAGIPGVTKGMLEGLRGTLAGGQPLLSRSLTIFAPESEIAGYVGEVQADNDDVAIGSYPFFRNNKLGAALVVRGTDDDRIRTVIEALRQGAESRNLAHEAGEGSDIADA